MSDHEKKDGQSKKDHHGAKEAHDGKHDAHDAHGGGHDDHGDDHGHGEKEDSENGIKSANMMAPILLFLVVLVIVLTRWCSAASHEREVIAEKRKAAIERSQAMHEARSLGQFDDRYTPATLVATSITDVYTDGEPIWVLPPGWPEKDAVYYSGKGRLNLTGGNIHAGTPENPWKFWSAVDREKSVLLRIWGK